MGKIFYLMGKSASGKDTIYKRLLNECPGLRPLILYTTRPMRDGESQGVEYYFVSQEELKNFEDAGKIIELRKYQTVAGIWSYATIDNGELGYNHENYLAIGTLESYKKMLDYFGKDIIIPIYIVVEDGLRLERALIRERQQKVPNYMELCRRFLADEKDFSPEKLEINQINKFYENNDLEQCIMEIKKKLS